MNKENYSPWNLFKESCEKFRDNTMLIYNGDKFTYGQIYDKVREFCSLIERWDFTIGGVFLPNCTEFITCMLGFNRQNRVFTCLSYQFKGETLMELINYTDIELLVTDAKGYDAIRNSIDILNIRVVLVLQENGSFTACEIPGKSRRELPGINENTFGICFTSGSTSRPKGIVLSNYAITGNTLAVAEHLGFTSADRTIIPRSLAQASPISGDVLMAISRGGGIILLNNVFHPAIFLKAIQEYKATNFYIVRTMLLQTLEYSQFKNYDLGSIKRILIGGMVNPLTIYRRAAEAFPGVRLYNAYGTSEASARVTFGEHEDVISIPCVIGKPMRGCDIKVFKEDGSEAAVGEMGELYMTSDYMMDGYYNSPQLTSEALGPKGFRVRDLGYKDGEGRFYVLSRNDDMIMQGGSRAYPIDIEEVLLKNPAIKETAVIGVDDEKLGQKIVAMVVLNQECHAEIKDIYKWCNSQLEDRKVPKEIHIIHEIPRNVIGKISKKDIKELYQSLISKQEAVS
jgi:acyl-CoA synthetase (AMP-forming)/AMP-acid ligase II